MINNNCGELKTFLLFFKIPMGRRKNFFEIYRQFGHAPSKRFASPAIGHVRTSNYKSPQVTDCYRALVIHS